MTTTPILELSSLPPDTRLSSAELRASSLRLPRFFALYRGRVQCEASSYVLEPWMTKGHEPRLDLLLRAEFRFRVPTTVDAWAFDDPDGAIVWCDHPRRNGRPLVFRFAPGSSHVFGLTRGAILSCWADPKTMCVQCGRGM